MKTNEEIKQYRQDYYQKNKTRILANNKKNYENNKKRILKQRIEYKEKNIDILKEYFTSYQYKDKDQQQLYNIKYRLTHKNQISEYNKTYYEANIDHETNINEYVITKNPTLKDIQFQSIKDTFTCFQDVQTYISNVLVKKEVNTKIADIDLLHSKGFDKYSFRKEGNVFKPNKPNR